MKYLLWFLAWLNETLAKRYIPRDTPYCYEYIKGKKYRRCPYMRRYWNEDGWDEYCHYLRRPLEIQDMCKDCLIGEYDNEEEGKHGTS